MAIVETPQFVKSGELLAHKPESVPMSSNKINGRLIFVLHLNFNWTFILITYAWVEFIHVFDVLSLEFICQKYLMPTFSDINKNFIAIIILV